MIAGVEIRQVSIDCFYLLTTVNVVSPKVAYSITVVCHMIGLDVRHPVLGVTPEYVWVDIGLYDLIIHRQCIISFHRAFFVPFLHRGLFRRPSLKGGGG